MKVSEYISGMLAAMTMALAVMACSDNLVDNMQPTEESCTMMIDGHETAFTLDLKASPCDTVMNVESNTLWKVVVAENEGGWFSVDKISGRGDETFTINVLENTNEPRRGHLTVYMTDRDGEIRPGSSSIGITLSQEVSDVRLSPSSLPPFKAKDNESRRFEITSNVEWTLDVSDESGGTAKFVTIIPNAGTMESNGEGGFKGDGSASFFISLNDNLTAADRKAFINLRSAVATYTVEITQIKPEYSFDVSPTEDLEIEAKGGSKVFRVLSLSDDGWDVKSSATWVKIPVESWTANSFDPVETVVNFAPNDSGSVRTAEIYFKPRDTSYQMITVNVRQRAYDVAFSVDRSDSGGPVSENGGRISYTLKSDFDWEISAPEWLSVVPNSGKGSSSETNINVTVAPNLTNEERSGTINVRPLNTVNSDDVTLKPESFGFVRRECEVVQRAFDAVFSVGRIDSEGVVPENGATLRYEINSSFDWQISSPSWMTVDQVSGSASSSSVRVVNVTVTPNRTNENRTGTLTVQPVPTASQIGVTLDPGTFGFGEYRSSVTQFGGREAAVSVPWLRDGYSMREATVEFNFYSPFRVITEAGLQWRKESDAEWSTRTAIPSNGTEATVSFDLTGLDPASKYVARGFVVDSDGNIKYGSVSYPFTTAGQYPSNSDNPTPEQ